jgi:CBS domain-containing protein
MRRISVGDLMTRNFISVRPTDSLHKCAKLMAKERLNSLVVTDNDHLVGILTSRDILWALSKKPGIDLRKISSIDIATRKLAVIKPSADISQALKKMKSSNFRRLPVLSKGQLIGVVTLRDILDIEPDLYTEMKPLIEVRERETKREKSEEEWPLEGMCDNCGSFSELLKVEGTLLCLDCRDEMF